MGFVISYRHRIGGAQLGFGLGRIPVNGDQGIALKQYGGLLQEGMREGMTRGARAEKQRYSWMVVDAPTAEAEVTAEREQLLEDSVPVIRPGDYFATVEGSSMAEAGLRHGQSVVVRPGAVVHEGDICAVWVEGVGEMIRRVYRGSQLVRLVPANAEYRSAVFPVGQVRILGVIVATLATQIFRR